jgi:hypothetical protein
MPDYHKEPYVNQDFHSNEPIAEDSLFYMATSFTAAAFSETCGALYVGLQIQKLTGDVPAKADKMMEDPTSADNRRAGMNRLVDFGWLDDPKVAVAFRRRCRQIAQTDPDPMVRAAAIRICNHGRDAAATSIFVQGLTDPNEWIRLESAKALVNVPDTRAIEPLLGILNKYEESRDIRVAAIDALKHYRTMAVGRALCIGLEDKKFVIAWQARQSLRYLTDRDFGYDSGAWLQFFTGPQNPLK